MANFNVEQLFTRQSTRLSQQQTHDTAMADQQDSLTRMDRVQPFDGRESYTSQSISRRSS